jgi:uncharacterized protein (TIGR03118 family)
LIVAASATTSEGASFGVTILTSDGPPGGPTGPNINIDPNLKNPWGLAFTATSPFWVGDQNSASSTLYGPGGVPNNTVGPVLIPVGTGLSGPTGVVANNIINGVSGSSFVIPMSPQETVPAPASFIFDTLNGTIAAWNGGTTGIGNKGTAAVEFTSTNGASFTGLAIGNNGTQDQLYAADNANHVISVFGPTYNPITNLPAGSFTLPTNMGFPTNAVPYNIQNINGLLYVTYQGTTGSLAIYRQDGTFVTGVTSSTLLNPWGMALAPAGFVQFGGDLLVGNKTNGQINAFDPNTLAFIGTLTNSAGQPLVTSPGLWGLAFRTGGGFDPNALYFSAGVNGGGNIFADGIFGEITAVPEPASAILLGLGLIVLCGICGWERRRRQNRPALAG